MNFDSAFVAALVHEGLPLILKAKGMGIRPDDLDDGEARIALQFLYIYSEKYREAPPVSLVVAESGADLDRQPGTADYFIDHQIEKKLFREVKNGLSRSLELLGKKGARDSFESLEGLLRNLRKGNQVRSPVESLFRLGDEMLSDYNDIKAGKKGILTRWPSINDSTMGFWPQDLVLLVARVATGKTWSGVIIAHDAWAGRWCDFVGTTLKAYEDPTQKKRILFVTTEMSKKRIANRFYAVRYKLPYKPFRSGKLGSIAESRMVKGVEELRDMDGLSVVGGDFDFTVSGLEAAIDQAEPHMVVLDGAYLLRSEGRNRTEQAANTFDDLKRLLHRYNIAGVVTSQLNRSANPNQRQTVNTESIALTDVAAWNADVAIAMIQDENQKRQKRMWLKPLKVREGEGSEIELQWDFDSMTFDELPGQGRGVPTPVPGTSGGDAAEAAPVEDDVVF